MPSVPYAIECCVENYDQALNAQEKGAHQVELCSKLHLDGLTPHRSDITRCLHHLNIPTKVMIRPYSGDFITTEQSTLIMVQEIKEVKDMGASHVVLGLTTKEYELDIDTLCLLRDLAYPMKVTIHKAIDSCRNMLKEVDRLVHIGGFDSVLTSGGAQTATEGATIIKKMMSNSQGILDIIAAGGIVKNNLNMVHTMIQAHYYHGRRILGEL